MKSKKKEVYVEKKGILNMGKDYHVYHMTLKDYLISWIIGFAIGFIVIMIFFASPLFSLFCGVGCAIFAPRIMKEYRRKRVVKNLRDQFKDLLESISSSYSAGKNTMDAFLAAESDMEAIYGANSDIVEEIKIINIGLKNNINIETMLLDFASRSEIDDVLSFANVFEVCNRQGGNLKIVVGQTRDIISDKMEIEMEIDTMLAGNKNELNIMILMPLIVVFMLNGLGSGTINENNLTNIIVKLFCIALFVGSYFLGRKITNIKI